MTVFRAAAGPHRGIRPQPLRALRDQRVVVPIMAVSTAFIIIADGAITIVALPAIARQFHLSPAALNGVAVVYPVGLATIVPASAWLLERFGGRRVLLLSLALFTLASGLCGAAQNLPELLVFRAAQGVAAGVLMPACQGLVFRTFSQSEQLRLSRIMIIPQQIAPAVAPLIGGVLVVTLDWRWVFYVTVPVGCAATLLGLFFLDAHSDGEAPRLDLSGLALSAAATGSLMYGVCAGPDQGWSTAPVFVPLAVGTALLVLTVVHQLRVDQPALRLRLFANRVFGKVSVLNLTGPIPTLGTMFLAPLFVQQAQGRSALASGSTTFTEAIGVLLTVQVVSVVYQRIGPGPIIGGALLGVAGVDVLLAGCDAHTSLWTLRLYMFLLGLAMGAFFIPLTVTSVATLDRADSAQAATLGLVVWQIGTGLGPTIVTTVLVLGTHHPSAGATPPTAAYQHGFLALAAIGVLAGLFALSLGRRPAQRRTAGWSQQ